MLKNKRNKDNNNDGNDGNENKVEDKIEENVEENTEDKAEMKNAVALEKNKFLIVDDEIDITEVLSDLLAERIDCEIKVATNGLDAFLFCQKKKFDVIFCDHRMPIMTGAGFIQALREKDNVNKSTPVIFFTQYIEEVKCSTQCLESVLFLEKGSPPQKLVNYVTMALKEKTNLKAA
ncbi:MAG: response regulator [Oligoflexia bacterium]|nr:response regulator [Oligoflexia bacterium]